MMRSEGKILGIPYFTGTYSDALFELLSMASEDNPNCKYSVYTPNVHHVHLFHTNKAFRHAYLSCSISLLDGMPLVWASRLLAKRHNATKISGSDIFVDLFTAALKNGLKIYLLGGLPEVANAAVASLSKGRIVTGQVLTFSPPLNFEKNDSENNRIIADINRFSPQILFVALGAPKQEIWINANIERIKIKVAMGVGGSFDFVAGTQKRAPVWMQKKGLEWLFRLLSDPKRLWKRYLITNTYFCFLIFKSLLITNMGRLINLWNGSKT